MDTSPLKELALIWAKGEKPSNQSEINAARARLYTAATHEITFKAAANISFDPLCSPLFKWCVQWLDVLEGTRPHIDPDVDTTFHLYIDPIPLSHRLLSSEPLFKD